MRIGRNPASDSVLRHLAQADESLAVTSERLSSGMRINKAADDAAGLAIAAGLNVAGRLLGQAVRNINDGVSYLNIADGALTELGSIVTRQLELASQSANGVYSTVQRRALNAEANALVDEYNRIVGSTEFNGLGVLDAARLPDSLKIQTGAHGSADDLLKLETGEQLSTHTGDGTFTCTSTFTTHSGVANPSARMVALADVNGDGSQDMIVAGQESSQGVTRVFLNDGGGNFSTAAILNTNVATLSAVTSAVTTGDINGDGKVDFVTNGWEDNGSGNRAVARVYLGDGAGNFSLKNALNAYDSGGSSVGYTTILEDFDGNGTLDLLTSGVDNTAAVAQIWSNDGNGTFSRSATFTLSGNSSGVMAAAVADLNNDGRPDIVAAGYGWQGVSTANMWTVTNNGAWNFSVGSEQVLTTGLNSGGRSVAVGDINGDGYIDAAIAGIDSSSGTKGVTYIMTNTEGTLTRTNTLTTNSGTLGYSYASNLSDLNGDGHLDLIVAGRIVNATEYGLTTTWLNNGKGVFNLAQSFKSNDLGTSSFTIAAAAGDVTGDGAVDIVAAGPVDRTGANFGQAAVFSANAHATTLAPHINIASQKSARHAITFLKSQLERISAERGTLGAAMRRLDAALSVTSDSRVELGQAESRIKDADMAKESADFLRLQIRRNAAAALASQVNRNSAIVLNLLNL